MKKLIFASLVVVSSCTSKKNCEIKVILDNGDVINGRYIQTYVSGVSNIKKCNGSDFQINTSDIKQINYK